MTGYPIPAQRYSPAPHSEPSSLADVLERVLDKGIVIAGDITIDLLKIELLTIKLRLLVASADKAREMGIDWWSSDPFLTGRGGDAGDGRLEERIDRLERLIESLSEGTGTGAALEAGEGRRGAREDFVDAETEPDRGQEGADDQPEASRTGQRDVHDDQAR